MNLRSITCVVWLLTCGAFSERSVLLADDPAAFLSMAISNAVTEDLGDLIFVRADLLLDNATGEEILVRSSVACSLDGLEVVITDGDGQIRAQQALTYHLSPVSREPLNLRLKAGKSTIKLSVPIALESVPAQAGVRLVGRLSGSNYSRLCSTNTAAVATQAPSASAAGDRSME